MGSDTSARLDAAGAAAYDTAVERVAARIKVHEDTVYPRVRVIRQAAEAVARLLEAGHPQAPPVEDSAGWSQLVDSAQLVIKLDERLRSMRSVQQIVEGARR